jgi:alanine racemase
LSYHISNIADIISATYLQKGNDAFIENLLTDSRKLLFPESSLFFALPGSGRNGTSFMKTLYDKGVRNFVADKSFSQEQVHNFPDANILMVNDVLQSLQQLAAYHRHQFTYPVIGITGSNGKTIVKEWLNQLLGEEYNIVRSPKSYNSQVGVPLSVWRMNESNTLGIFESGISKAGEMRQLQKIIDPELGIVTFIGSAHAEGFESTEQKIREKLLLFKNTQLLIYDLDDERLAAAVADFQRSQNVHLKTFTKSNMEDADLFVKKINRQEEHTVIDCVHHGNEFSFSIPFTDDASVSNALTCCCAMLVLNISIEQIKERMLHLRPLEMRLEMKQGINNCTVINDGYSADLNSLSIALDFLEQQQQHEKRTVILSDLLQSGKDADKLYKKVAGVLSQKNIYRFIGIGPGITVHAGAFEGLGNTLFFESTEAFIAQIAALHFEDETILLKGARIFRFEKISSSLEYKVHETLLEINLNALRHNLKVYREQLLPGVRIMAMVKAFSYGSGSYEIAGLMQHAGVEYLAVAYADEGADLRRNGIKLPVMVMNTEESGFESIVKYNLEPEIYSFHILHAFKDYLQQHGREQYPVHIKIDTGMHRLGFETSDTDRLCEVLKNETAFKIVSVFSHLAGSDSDTHDDFTMQQAALYHAAADKIQQALGYDFIKHLSNSSAIYRHPQLQMGMVRLGIGLYGVDASPVMQHKLQYVTTLRTTISQIRHVKAGESIGYSRKGVVQQDSVIATVRIGYADGYPRILSNGRGKMLVAGNPAPVVGNVCMDMTMLDITGIDAEEGDDVIVFGEEPSVTDVAGWADTISYEILTNISQRVKRVYFEE